MGGRLGALWCFGCSSNIDDTYFLFFDNQQVRDGELRTHESPHRGLINKVLYKIDGNALLWPVLDKFKNKTKEESFLGFFFFLHMAKFKSRFLFFFDANLLNLLNALMNC